MLQQCRPLCARAKRGKRPDAGSSISERALIEALKAANVDVTAAQLSDWRKEGLLPPLSSRGRGTGGGRIYYWNDTAIRDQARCVHELLERHGRHCTAMLVLWLCGYPVPAARARRAWLRRASRPRIWQLRHARPEAGGAGLFSLPHLALLLCGSLSAGQRTEAQSMYAALARMGEMFGLTQDLPEESKHRFFTSLHLVLGAIEDSSLLALSRDADMEAARHLTQTLVALAQPVLAPAAERALEQMRLMDAVGAPIFLCSLLLLRTGYGARIAASQAALTAVLSPLQGGPIPPDGLDRLRRKLSGIWNIGHDPRQTARDA